MRDRRLSGSPSPVNRVPRRRFLNLMLGGAALSLATACQSGPPAPTAAPAKPADAAKPTEAAKPAAAATSAPAQAAPAQAKPTDAAKPARSEEHTSELQSPCNL